MGTPEQRRARPGEVYVALSDTTVVFPAVVENERWEGFVRPHFDRATAEAVAVWLNENHGRDPLAGHFTPRSITTCWP
jgi:hypothetical protein